MNGKKMSIGLVATAAAVVLGACSDGDKQAQATDTQQSTMTQHTTDQLSAPAAVPGSPAVTKDVAPQVSPANPNESGGCAVPGGATAAINNAIGQIAPAFADRPEIKWRTGSQPGNLDGCRDLSYVTLAIEGATGSSPDQLLLFHRGRFLGTGSKCNVAFQDVTGSTDSSVNVTYRYLIGDDANANPRGQADITYRWTGSSVQMVGTLPAEVTNGKC